MRDELRERIHHANVVMAVTLPIFAIVAFLLTDADEAVLQGVGLAYFVIVFALFFALGERADRRRQRRDQ